jgi:tetratricopeptide (TPR) repeat protein
MDTVGRKMAGIEWKGAVRARRVASLGLLFLFACAVFAQSSGKAIRHVKVEEDSSWPPELTQAEANIEKKDYAAAEPLLRKVVEHDSANYLAWYDLGFVLNALGKPDESIAAYRKSVAAKPEVFESNLNLGLMLAKNKQPGAEQFLRAATALKPTSNADEGRSRAWLSLAHVLESRNPDEAIDAYHKAAQLDPKDPEPHLSAAPLLEKQNRFADAEQEYKAALALNPASTDGLTGLANLYMRGHRFHDAEATLSKLAALEANDPAIHMQLGRMYAAAEENDEAIRELQIALKLAPTDAEIQRDLASVYFSAAKYAEAEAQYRALISTQPTDAELHHRLGQVLLNQKKFPEAQQELLTAIKLKPDLGAAYGDLAFVANENKNYELVIKALDTRAQFLGEIPATYFLRATAYDHLHDRKHAAENYHHFLETDGGKNPEQEWQARHRLIAIEPKK